MFRRSGDLVLVVGIAAVALLLALLAVDVMPLRVAFALPLMLMLPGYAISEAAFAGRAFGFAERLLFSFGLSLATAALGGLALNWTPWGVQTESWAVLLFSITLGAGVIALVRRRGAVPAAVTTPNSPRLTMGQGLLLGLAVLVGIGAIGMARIPTPPQDIQGYTMLWMTPDAGAPHNTVRLGVRSMEFTPVTYRLAIEINDKDVREWPLIALAPGETWEEMLPIEQAGANPVKALLFRLDAPPGPPYRHVEWWPARS